MLYTSVHLIDWLFTSMAAVITYIHTYSVVWQLTNWEGQSKSYEPKLFKQNSIHLFFNIITTLTRAMIMLKNKMYAHPSFFYLNRFDWKLFDRLFWLVKLPGTMKKTWIIFKVIKLLKVREELELWKQKCTWIVTYIKSTTKYISFCKLNEQLHTWKCFCILTYSHNKSNHITS